MIEGWDARELGELIDLNYGKDHKHLNDGNIPCLGSGGLMRYVDQQLSGQEAILIPRKGSLNNIQYANSPFWTVDTLFWGRVLQDQIFGKFLFYQLRLLDFTTLNVGSAVPSLTVPVINEIEVTCPPLSEQKAIARVLSSLDDKIDLLHRQNKTLEALAETLFRQWFIEEAKDDWDKCRLGELIQFKYGKALKKSLRTGVGYPVVGSGGVVDFHSEALVKGVGIVTGRKGTLGDQHYFWDGFFPIDTTFYIVPKRQTKNMLFEYFLLRTIDFKRMNSDSAVPGLNREIAGSAEIINPPSSLKVQFDEGVGTLFDKIRFNNLQIKTLEKLRDTLLPKLMNGEVRVDYDREAA